MTWAKELEELRQREALADQMGGPEKVAKQHGRGKMDARARLAALCDEGSFREIGKIAGKGHYDENGDWPPHLHFQLIVDMQEYRGDYPGACTIDEQDWYAQNCPDPRFFLGI